jgi:hypothetical protein
MVKPVTFEEACEISRTVVTADRLRDDLVGTMVEMREQLAAVGWTPAALCDVAAARMKIKIAALREAEEEAKS